ncbi:monovalent cation/H+ antiporter subunit D family protein [Amycolatopsis sp. KNN50.9b]|uniref:monovalent cation/H+ antiporter subunit D family protein n=1 Tax=Amycolatopsis sp. KNN50.9b TaxID=2018303 RepID=UPI000B8A9F3D|nr:monovalent cation/H+ antiporter subunit D family protein [Amycolatopsis sp. KNN50.9b]OXM75145.1 cation:proton antiporter [Amycolatopsis sp. KNN50.9b]
MTSHLPVLPVLIPLAGAPLCVLLRSRTAAWLLFLLASAGALACAVLLAVRVAGGGALRYEIGGWPAPYGIEFVIAAFNTPVLLLVPAIATVTAVYGRRSIGAEIDDGRAPLLYTCLCLTLAGLLGLSVTGDVFNAFVFLEISSLSTYALVALGRHRRALLAAFRYLVIGTVGATFVLIGIGLAYAVTGTLNMADLAQRLAGVQGNRALYAAVVFVLAGLAVKMAVFPLHAWLPGAYAEAPSAVSTFLSATSTKVAIYVFCRFAFTVFGAGLVFRTMPMETAGLVLACVAMLAGSAVACFQTDLKYLLAWSSVAQIGYIVAGIGLATAAGVSAGYLHLINHAVIKSALFATAGLLLLRLGSVRLTALAGLGRRMPWTFAAIVVAGLGLVGVPPTAGFVSKWALVSALLGQGRWPVVVAVLVSSLLALVYVGRVVEAAWFRPALPGSAGTPKPPPSMVAAIWVLVLASVYFGLDPALPSGLAGAAATALLGGRG